MSGELLQDHWSSGMIMFLSFWTCGSGQTVQTQIRLLLGEQSDQGLHCLHYRLHLLKAIFHRKTFLFKFLDVKLLGVRIVRTFTISFAG